MEKEKKSRKFWFYKRVYRKLTGDNTMRGFRQSRGKSVLNIDPLESKIFENTLSKAQRAFSNSYSFAFPLVEEKKDHAGIKLAELAATMGYSGPKPGRKVNTRVLKVPNRSISMSWQPGDGWGGRCIKRSEALRLSRISKVPLDRRAISRACKGTDVLLVCPYLKKPELLMFSPLIADRVARIARWFGLKDLRSCVAALRRDVAYLLGRRAQDTVYHRNTAFPVGKGVLCTSYKSAVHLLRSLPERPGLVPAVTLIGDQAYPGYPNKPLNRRLPFRKQFPDAYKRLGAVVLMRPTWRSRGLDWKPAYTARKMGFLAIFQPSRPEENAAIEALRLCPAKASIGQVLSRLRQLDWSRTLPSRRVNKAYNR